jgi:RNA polymerase sigma-70 factor (ECF subfamily)
MSTPDLRTPEPGLRTRIEEACRGGAAAWPGVRVLPDQLFEFVVAHHAPAEVDSLHWDDLYLACACSLGDAVAIRRFEQHLGADLDRVVRRFHAAPIPIADLRQIVVAKLFVAAPDARPKIAAYAGAGSLRAWLRVAAVRTCIDAVRAEGSGPGRPLDDDGDDPLLGTVDDVELTFLKQHYRAAFRRAFEAAVHQLSSRERNLLRHVAVGGLTQDQISAIYGVHRVTAARWIGSAQRKLCEETRVQLQAQLALPVEELESIFKLIESQIDLSLQRVLCEREPC